MLLNSLFSGLYFFRREPEKLAHLNVDRWLGECWVFQLRPPSQYTAQSIVNLFVGRFRKWPAVKQPIALFYLLSVQHKLKLAFRVVFTKGLAHVLPLLRCWLCCSSHHSRHSLARRQLCFEIRVQSFNLRQCCHWLRVRLEENWINLSSWLLFRCCSQNFHPWWLLP